MVFEAVAEPPLVQGAAVHVFRSGPHKNFHYAVADPKAGAAALVDPAFELPRLFGALSAAGLAPATALFTHGHWDHIGGIPDIVQHGVHEVCIHEAASAHPKLDEARAAGADIRLLHDGDVIQLGKLEVEVLHTPGHQPEGSCFLARTDPPCLFGGDTLFIGSCGRTDFPGGDTDAMFESMARLRGLPDETIIFPGHDYADAPWRTLGEEKDANPALSTADQDAFRGLHCLTH